MISLKTLVPLIMPIYDSINVVEAIFPSAKGEKTLVLPNQNLSKMPMGERKITLLHADSGRDPYHLGSMFFKSSPKTIVIDNLLEQIDRDASWFLTLRQYRLLEQSSEFVRAGALLVCDVASYIFMPAWAACACQFFSHFNLSEYLEKRAENEATWFVTKRATQEELQGAIRICFANIDHYKIMRKNKEKMIGPDGRAVSTPAEIRAYENILKKAELAYKERFRGTDQQIEQIKSSQQCTNIQRLLQFQKEFAWHFKKEEFLESLKNKKAM